VSIALRFSHVEGLRLRQQSAHEVARTPDNQIIGGKEWRFDVGADRKPLEVEQDKDERRRDAAGQPTLLGTYTAHVTAGLRNVVVEKTGKAENIPFRNGSVRNKLKVRYQTLVEHKNEKTDKVTHKWQDSGTQFVDANSWGGAFIGETMRVIMDEMPT
jgi:hypothetical protein